jgi:hypothetical protein
MATIWNEPNDSLLETLLERETAVVQLPLVGGIGNVTIQKISGSLPRGMRLSGTTIVGTPFQVARDITSTFVLRATLDSGEFQDRTYHIIVAGPDSPIWLTQEGFLPVGNNGLFFILDSSPVNFQLSAIDEDIPAGDELEFYISNKDGVLPPGLTLSRQGVISGIVDPILALDKAAGNGGFDSNKYDGYPYDFAALSANGYDSFFYDSGFYDDSLPTLSPKKLNRFYEFAVTISDGDTTSKRVFKIYVVGDDFLRADNTIQKAGTGLFTADNTYVRTPIWLTPANLGFKRANNYVTVFLDTLDTSTTQGVIRYQLRPENDDSTISKLPPGLSLSSTSGELYGRIPYQPAVTQDYKFTIRATRFTGDITRVEINVKAYEDTLSGKRFLKIVKLSNSLEDGIDDLAALVNQTIQFSNNTYQVITVDGTSDDYDVLELSASLQPAFPIIVNSTSNISQSYIFVNKLAEANKVQLQGSMFRFSDNETYTVNDIIPYTTWNIRYSNSSALEIDPTNIGLDEVPGETFAQAIERAFPNSFYSINQDNLLELKVPSTSVNRNESRIADLFAPSNNEITVKSSLVAFYTRINLDVGLQRTLQVGTDLGIGTFKDELYISEQSITSTDETTRPFKDKTFTISLLGEVDSTIKWLTSSDLGTINANFLSTLSVKAETTVPNAKLLYRLTSGSLPNGLELAFDGEIIGKVKQFGEPGLPGLTIFDSGNCTFDGAETSFDRVYTFTVEARDRFNFSATSRTFTITVADPNDLLYSNLYLKPLLTSTQRSIYTQLVSDPNIFPPSLVYRPNDPEFGLQKDIRMLAYAGIETKTIDEYVAAVAKNHKRKKFKFGEIKTAVAKNPGSNDILYEIVYAEVIDPVSPITGTTRESFSVKNKQKITVDSMKYDTQKDIFQLNTGLPEMYVNGVRVTTEQLYHSVVGPDNIITIGDTNLVDIEGNPVTVTAFTDSEPFKYRPQVETITVDNDAVRVGNKSDSTRYLSNITNMRNRIAAIGDTERNFLPLWMRTPQTGNIQEIGYTLAVPLCYCVPGGAARIKLNLDTNGFDFKQINFDVDRYIIDSTTGNSNDQYILFANYQYNI